MVTYISWLSIFISWKPVIFFLLGQQWQMKDLGNMWMETCYSGQQMWNLMKDIKVQHSLLNCCMNHSAFLTIFSWTNWVQVFILESLLEVCMVVLWLCKLSEEVVSCAEASQMSTVTGVLLFSASFVAEIFTWYIYSFPKCSNGLTETDQTNGGSESKPKGISGNIFKEWL